MLVERAPVRSPERPLGRPFCPHFGASGARIDAPDALPDVVDRVDEASRIGGKAEQEPSDRDDFLGGAARIDAIDLARLAANVDRPVRRCADAFRMVDTFAKRRQRGEIDQWGRHGGNLLPGKFDIKGPR